MLVSFAFTSIINYAFGIAIGWLVIPSDFGLFAFVQTLVLLGALVLNAGFAWSLTTSIAGATPLQRPLLIRGAIIQNVVLAGILSLSVVFAFALGPLQNGLETWSIVVLVTLSMPFLAVVSVEMATMRGLERFGELAFLRIFEMACKAAGGLLLVSVGYGIQGAVAGFLIGAVLASCVGGWRVNKLVEMRVRGQVAFPPMSITINVFSSLVGLAFLLNLDIVALKLFTDDERELTGFYQAAIVLANTSYYVATALFDVLLPKLTKSKDAHQQLLVLSETLRVILIFLVPINIVLTLEPVAVLALIFPASYIASAEPLRILAIGNIFLILTAMFVTFFNAVGRSTLAAKVILTLVTLEVVLLNVFVPRYFALGAAGVFTCTSIVATSVLGLVFSLNVERKWLWTGISWLFRYLITASLAAISLVGLFYSTKSIIVAVLVTIPCYFLVLLLLRVLTLPNWVAVRIHLPKHIQIHQD